jgi:hypothetical protein
VTRSRLLLNDLALAGELSSSHLERLASREGWVVRRAPGLDWTSREVVDHLCNTMAFYANHAVQEATDHQPRIRSLGEQDLSDAELARTVQTWVRLLAAVITSKPAGWRGWHPLGMTDAEGFIALACNELLVHTHDVVAAHEEPLVVEELLCTRVLSRLFPDDAAHVGDYDAWSVLLYANGRAELGSRLRKQQWRSHPETDSEA